MIIIEEIRNNMALSPEQQSIIQVLADAVSKNGSAITGTSFSTPNATTNAGDYRTQRNEAIVDRKKRTQEIKYDKAVSNLENASRRFKDLSKTQNKSANEMNEMMKISNHFFSKALDSADSYEEINKKIPEKFQQAIEKHFQNLDLGFNVKDLEGMTVLMERANVLSSTMADLSKNQTIAEKDFESMSSDFQKFGINLADFASYNKKTKTLQIVDNAKYKEAQTKLTDTTEKLEKAQKEASQSFIDTKENLKNLKSALMATIGPVVAFGHEMKTVMNSGLGANSELMQVRAARMGLTLDELADSITKNRQVQFAMGKSQTDYINQMGDAASTFSKTAKISIDNASKAVFAFSNNVSMFGVTQSKLGKAVMDQTKIYKDNYQSLGISTEQFSQMTQSLVEDKDIRTSVARLKEKDRKQYIEGIQLREAEYVTMGHSIE